MKIYDISQEVFDCAVFPGDPTPQREVLCDISKGAVCHLTAFSMCAHNGTHIDAPLHFLRDGASVEQIPLKKTVGYAYVAFHEGALTAKDAARILKRAEQCSSEAAKRILIKGRAVISLEAAETFAASGVLLIGNESQTVGPEDAPMAVHLLLLGQGIVLLEGLRLCEVPEGAYLLNAAPLKLGQAEGAPCRAILIELEEGEK